MYDLAVVIVVAGLVYLFAAPLWAMCRRLDEVKDNKCKPDARAGNDWIQSMEKIEPDNTTKSYTVIERTSKHELSGAVNSFMANGWHCIGGVEVVAIELNKGSSDARTEMVWIQAIGHKDDGASL